MIHEETTFPSPCELKPFPYAAVTACDDRDSLLDGVINDPDLCHFDPYPLVGQDPVCEEDNITITEKVAGVVLKMLRCPFNGAGKPLWYGLNALYNLANTTTTTSGERTRYSFFVNDA